MANTIASELQLTEVLDSALEAFRRAVLPLKAFSTVYEQVALQGDDTVTVAYYPLATSSSQTRTPTGSYKALATSTDTQSKQITINKNKVQVISFSSQERNRQPRFDPIRHGRMKGEKLAFDIVADVWSLVKASNFTASTISASTAANFDEDDVADLAQKCMEANWPEMERYLILDPGFWYNLCKQPALLDLSQSGEMGVLRGGKLPNIFGFQTIGSNGVQRNNGTAATVTSTHASDTLNLTAHGFVAGDRVEFKTSAADLPSGLSVDTYYYVISSGLTADAFKVSATAGGSAVALADDGTGTHTVELAEDLAGAAVYPSAILCAFCPNPPTEAVRQQLYDYRVVTDGESGAVLEYKHFGIADTDEEVQVIEAHYGYALGETAALKRIQISGV